MNLSHMIIVGIIILIVVPPEKLPQVMRTLGSLINDIRRQTSGVWENLKNEAAFKPEDAFKDNFQPADHTAQNTTDVPLDVVSEKKEEEIIDDNKPKQS